MKYKIVLFSFIFAFCAFNSCKESTNKNGNQDGQNNSITEIISADPDIVEARDRAKEKLIGTNKVGFYSKLIQDYWLYDVVVKGTGTVDDYAGHWLKFNDNQEYTRGANGKDIETGKWNYNPTSTVLTMLPDDGSLMPTEFRLMAKANTIICVGTADFRNNDTQIKLVSSPDIPSN